MPWTSVSGWESHWARYRGRGRLVLQGAFTPEVRYHDDRRVPDRRERAQGSRGEEQAALNRRGMVEIESRPETGDTLGVGMWAQGASCES